MKQGTIATIIITALLVAGGMYALELRSTMTQQPQQALGDLNRFTDAPTNTKIACTTSSTLVVATSTGRQYVAIINDEATNPVYLGLGRAAVGSNGIRLNANGGSFEITQENLFTGAIYCIASSTATLTVVSK